jgi:hypothetical protein
VFDADLAMLAPWWRAAFGPKEPLPAQVVCRITNLDEMLAGVAPGRGSHRALCRGARLAPGRRGRVLTPMLGEHPLSCLIVE